ncbi:MAG: DUF541 domain-containing protein [Chloroflexi bacterium]|nr:MAG: DUF541 domain-containing protein [Chloroflexota bacterium]
MKKYLTSILVTILVVGLLSGIFSLQAGNAQTPTVKPEPAQEAAPGSVTVSGTGTAQASPDVAFVTVGVQTEAEEASAALAQNNEQMDQLIAALTEAGIAREDIQTQFFQLYPQYQGPTTPEGQPELSGYVAVNTVQVRVENLSELGNLLDIAVEAGGNLIQNVRFEISDQDALLEQAREEAFNNARSKAEQLAGLAGSELGSVISINESGISQPFPLGLGGGDVTAEQAAVPIEPGSQTVSASIQVTWRLESGE